jgi:hypothetical protein
MVEILHAHNLFGRFHSYITEIFICNDEKITNLELSVSYHTEALRIYTDQYCPNFPTTSHVEDSLRVAKLLLGLFDSEHRFV